MSVGKSRIGDLSVNSDFDFVLSALNKMSDELYTICFEQSIFGVDTKEITDKLNDIDKYISKNPVIKKGRIEGSEDVKKIIDLVNQEVSQRLKGLKENIEDKSDIESIEKVEDNFKENKTNTMQKNLENFERKTIEVKPVSEREEEANEIIENRTERLEKAKGYKDLVKKIKDRDPKKDETAIQTDLLNEASKISRKLSDIEKREKNISKLKESKDYKDILSKLTKQAQKAKYDVKDLTKKDLNAMRIAFEELGKLKDGNNEIEILLSEVEGCLETENKNGVKVIKEIKDPQKLFDTLGKDKYQKLDWKEAISSTKEFYDDKTKKDVEEMLKYTLFEIYPEKLDSWKRGLKAGVKIEDIVSEISAIGKDEIKLRKQISSLDKDSKDINKLELDKLRAEKRKSTYENLAARQKTTVAKLFGQDIELTNHRGVKTDFAKVDDEDREDVVENLYDKIREDGNLDEIDRRYDAALPVEYRKPGLLSRIWYKVTHRETWGTGKGLADQRKENWVKEQIGKEIDDIKEDASGDKSWTLTPEQAMAFNERQKDVVEKAKRKAREDMVKKGKNVKNAHKVAKEEYKILQREDDEDFTL